MNHPTQLLIALIACVAQVATCSGHGFPLFVSTDGTRLTLINQTPVGELIDDGFEIFGEDPGIGVNFAVTGPPATTELYFETLGGLLYWDGADVAETTAQLTIEAPEFDSTGQPNSTDIPEYVIHADSAPQTGMRWHTYPGGNFWDAHGFYTLSPSATAGVYGVPFRLTSPGLEASVARLLPLVFDPFGHIDQTAGVSALRSLVESPVIAGDYDLNGQVDAADHNAWATAYGMSPVIPGAGADGNSDGLINAADYTVWRDVLEASPQGLAVPEPSGLSLVLIANGVLLRRNRMTNDLGPKGTTP